MTHKPGLVVFASRPVAGAVGIAKAVLGIEPADAETMQRRIATCEACPDGCYQTGPSRCDRANGGCGCFLAAKWRIASEKCPKGHW